MEDDDHNNNEGDSSSPEESNDPFTTSSKIRRRLGPLLDHGFILVNRKWLEKGGPDPNRLTSILPMLGYSFVISDEEATI